MNLMRKRIPETGSATANALSPHVQWLVPRGVSIRGAEAALGSVAAGRGEGQ